MAQAGSAQREPSMEEILASIRRIIEDNDTGRKDGDQAASALPRDGAQESGSVIEVDAFRAELRARPELPEQHGSEPRFGEARVAEQRKPFSLADVQADIRRESAAEVRPAPAVPGETPHTRKPFSLAEIQAEIAREARIAPEQVDEVAQSAPQTETVVPSAVERASLTPAAAQPAPEPENAFVRAVPVRDPAPATQPRIEPVPAAARDVPSTDQFVPRAGPVAASPQPAKPLIISEQAGRQIAASFGELSEAFAARSRKTFDEMAEQMMRPMLQDWLDNNLPLLVERLVREEIERVARGL